MSNVVSFSSRDPAVSKQEIVDTLNRLIGEHDGLKFFATNFLIALEQRVWEGERRFVDGTVIPPCSFHDFIHKKYPYGIGADYETVENLIRDRADVLALWVDVTKRKPGNPTGANQHTKDDGELGIVDNIHNSSPERPSGTSAAAGLRKLQKAAAEGNEKAAEELQEVVAGAKSVHRACVESGLRKSPKIDSDVKQRAARALAEWIVEHAAGNDLDAVKANLFAAGAKNIAVELTNLLGESIMDRRYGS